MRALLCLLRRLPAYRRAEEAEARRRENAIRAVFGEPPL